MNTPPAPSLPSATVFQLVPAHSLPSIDLSKTLLSYAVSARSNASITQWIRRNITRLAWSNRIGLVGIIAGFFLPRAVSKPLMVICTALCLVGAAPTVVLLNVPVLLLLLRQYDFWVFSLLNLINWIICAALFEDLRAFSCIVCWLNTELIICIDSNTRTLMTMMRGARLWLPGVLAITVGGIFRTLDIDGRHYEPLALSPHDSDDERKQLDMTLVNLFANISVTLSIYVGTRLYFKRRVLSPCFRQHCMIPSSVFRINVALEMERKREQLARIPLNCTAPTLPRVIAKRSSTLKRSTHSKQTRRLSWLLRLWRPVRAIDPVDHASTPAEASALRLSTLDVQQMKLIRPRITNFSSDNTLIRGFNAQSSKFVRLGVALSGCIGLTATLYGLTTRIHAGVASTVGLVLSSVFVAILLGHCNRQVLWSLATNFDVVYLSFQSCTSVASIGMSLRERDHRMRSYASALLWLHLMLSIDALFPDVRLCLGLRKRFFAPPMLGAVALGSVLLHSILTGSTTVMPSLENRVVLCLVEGDFCIYTLSFLSMRVLSQLVALIRLTWALAIERDNVFIIYRGRVEFYAPAHRLPFGFDDTITPSNRVHSIILPQRE